VSKTAAPASSGKRRWTCRVLSGLAGVFSLIQLVPYGHGHGNPPVVKEPDWDSPITRATAVRSCYDCHSNETRWPWYSNVAPLSWFIRNHVDRARYKLNFSEFQRPQNHACDAAEYVEKGGMAPYSYRLVHHDASLSETERDSFIKGLKVTLAAEKRSSPAAKK
jgi:hypothetical protein